MGAVVLFLAVPMVLSSQSAPDWTNVQRFFRQQVTDAGLVGASLVIVREGKAAAEEYVGYQDNATRRPVDRDTIYHWASITKTFTGIAIVQLRDRGLLALDDPAVKYLPEIRQIHNPFGDVSQITIRRLMSHSAGLHASTWPWGGDKPWHPFEPTEWSQLVAMFPYTEVLFAPGKEYRYSNPGIVLLGGIIETLTGDDYAMYVTKNILMPLEMHQTFFDRAPYHLRDHRSHSYTRTDNGLEEMRFDFDTGITVSNGGLNAPLTDMARYLGFLIGNPSRPEYESVLRRNSLEEMWKPVIKANDGEGGSGTDGAGGALLLCRAPRHCRSDRPQRQPERLPLPSLPAHPIAFGLRRRLQHRRVLEIARQAAPHPRRGRRAQRSSPGRDRREALKRSGAYAGRDCSRSDGSTVGWC